MVTTKSIKSVSFCSFLPNAKELGREISEWWSEKYDDSYGTKIAITLKKNEKRKDQAPLIADSSKWKSFYLNRLYTLHVVSQKKLTFENGTKIGPVSRKICLWTAIKFYRKGLYDSFSPHFIKKLAVEYLNWLKIQKCYPYPLIFESVKKIMD